MNSIRLFHCVLSVFVAFALTFTIVLVYAEVDLDTSSDSSVVEEETVEEEETPTEQEEETTEEEEVVEEETTEEETTEEEETIEEEQKIIIEQPQLPTLSDLQAAPPIQSAPGAIGAADADKIYTVTSEDWRSTATRTTTPPGSGYISSNIVITGTDTASFRTTNGGKITGGVFEIAALVESNNGTTGINLSNWVAVLVDEDGDIVVCENSKFHSSDNLILIEYADNEANPVITTPFTLNVHAVGRTNGCTGLVGTAISDASLKTTAAIATIKVTEDVTNPSITGTSTLTSNNASSTTEWAKVGDVITYEFRLSEILKSTPTVTIAGVSVTPTNMFLEYTATYTVVAGSTNGTVVATIGTLTDLGDNTATPANFSSTLKIDTVAPTPTVTISDGIVGIAVTGTVSAAEVGSTGRKYNCGGGGAGNTDQTLTGTSFTCTYTTAGSYTVTVKETDAAGNEGSGTADITIAANVAPTVVISGRNSDPTNQAYPITITATDADTTDDVVTIAYKFIRPTSLLCNKANYDAASSTETTETIALTGSPKSGTHVVNINNETTHNNTQICIKATDSVGGEAYQFAGPFQFDTTDPSIDGTPTLTSNNASSTTEWAIATNTITYTFKVDEPLASTPTVTIAGVAATVTPAGNTYAATYPVVAGSTNGAVSVDVGTLTDPAGNTFDPVAFQSPTMKIDTVLPTVTISRRGTGTLTNASPTDTITFTFSEEFSATTPDNFVVGDVVVDNGALSAFAVDGSDPKIYTATLTAEASSDDDVTINIAAGVIKDLAGNANTAATELSISADRVNPSITQTALSTNNDNGNSWAKAGNTITHEFTVSEALASTPTVTIANGNATVTNTGLVYTATYVVPATGAPQGTFSILEGTLTDVNGNTTNPTATISTTQIDTVLPIVTNLNLKDTSDTCVLEHGSTTACIYGTRTDDITNPPESDRDTNSSLFFDVQVTELNPRFYLITDGDNTRGTTTLTTAQDNATLDVSVDSVNSNNSGNFFVEKVYTTMFTLTDQAGNEASTTLDLDIRINAPAAPTLVDLVAGDDTGESNTDNLTNKAGTAVDGITLAITAPTANSLINIKDGVSANDQRLLTTETTIVTTAGGIGNIDVILENPTTDGVKQIVASAYNIAGIESAAASSATLNVRLDKTIEEGTFTVPATRDDGTGTQETNDSGYSNSDRVTNVNDTFFTVGAIEQKHPNLTPFTGATAIEYQGSDIKVYTWADTNADGNFLTNGVMQTGELTELFSEDDLAATTKDFKFSPLTDGVHRIVVYQEDHAGNEEYTAVSNLGYTASTGAKDSNVLIIDTEKPATPSAPNLRPEDDTFGAYANPSRDGTSQDNTTHDDTHTYQSIASSRDFNDAADLTGGALLRETHTIDFYTYAGSGDNIGVTTPATGDQIGVPSTDLNAPTAFSSNISSTTATRAVTAGGAIFDDTSTGIIRNANVDYDIRDFSYTSDDGGGYSSDVFVRAIQVDLAGNQSDPTAYTTVKLDNNPPDAIEEDLTLHTAFDTGDSNTDKNTANTAPIFYTLGKSDAADTDYYVLYRSRLDHSRASGSDFRYPSDIDTTDANNPFPTDDQVSGNLLKAQVNDPDCPPAQDISICRGNAITTLNANSHLDTYTNGVAVHVRTMDVPAFNTWYGFQIVSIDLAGNPSANVNLADKTDLTSRVQFTVGGIDQSNLRILVPPPTPEKFDLQNGSDSTRVGYTAGATDDVTKETTITLDGRFGNGLTSTGNQATEERTNDAAQGATAIELNVTKIVPAGDNVTRQVVLNIDHTTPANSDVVVAPRGAPNTPYTFSPEINLETLFGADFSDAEYQFTAVASARGDRGSASEALSVTIDTTSPTLGSTEALLKTERGLSGTADRRVKFIITSDDNADVVISTVAEDSTETELSGKEFVSTSTTDYSEDFNYHYKLVDKAGNKTELAALPDNLKAPRLTSYTIDSTTHTRVVIGELFGDNAENAFEFKVSATPDGNDRCSGSGVKLQHRLHPRS